MIEGNLSDVSLPGLLQFLATESNKSYKVSLESAGQKGSLLVCKGVIQSANFGLLEGNDALTELLFWPQGSFTVEPLASDGPASGSGGGGRDDLKIPLKQVNTFADQMVFLREAAVGLNSEIVPSLSFGTQAWQEALAKQPLLKEDYAVLGWITDGRTMRQAMREFNFDVVRATSSLFRLLVTGSVEILRATKEVDAEYAGETPINGLAAILDNMQAQEDADAPGATDATDATDGAFDATPGGAGDQNENIGEAALAAQIKGGQAEAQSKSNAPQEASEASAAKAAEVSKPDPVKVSEVKSSTTGIKGEFAPPQEAEKKSLENAGEKTLEKPVVGAREANTAAATQSSVGTATGATINAVPGMMGSDLETITCDSLPAVGSKEFAEIMAKAQKASTEPMAYAKDVMKEFLENPSASLAASSQVETQQIHLPTSFRTSSDKIAAVSADSLTMDKAATLARQTLDKSINMDGKAAATDFSAASASSSSAKATPVATVNAWAAAVSDEKLKPAPMPALASAAASKAVEESPEKRLFDIVRTDPLPIVAIDIERLFQTSFHVSPFGHISVGNGVLEADLQKLLEDFKKGKTFITVATEEDMLPAQVLHYCKYCLERGYLDPPDAVASLTADLLLGRVELEQYLLQRRRITGDELRDVIEVARQKGMKLTDLLVKLGFMTASDWDRLSQEKERFARR